MRHLKLRHLRRVAPCMAALGAIALAVVGLAAAPALAALPEFSPAAPIPFTSSSGTSTLETVSKIKVKCKADTDKGEITGPNTVIMVVSFTGCETKGPIMCNSPNGVAGEIVTAVLSGTLGYIVNPEVKEVGLDLSSPTGAVIAEFTCGAALRAIVVGSVIGQITPVNKLLLPPKHFTLKFKQAKGKQSITHLSGGPIDVLMTSFGGPFEESGLSSSDKVSFAAPLEIKA